MAIVKLGSTPRKYTCAVLELCDNGFLDQKTLIQDLLGWMSEDDVKQFCEKNLRDFFDDTDEENEECGPTITP